MSLARTLTKWLLPAAALFTLACALLAPVEAGNARRPHRARAQDTRKQQVEEPDATPADSVVRGRVVYDDTSRPVRRARVMLITDGGSRGEYAALTDARGDFVIRGVRAGTYYAFVDVPGVLSPVGFVSVEALRTASSAPDLGEGRKYFDLVEVDGKEDVNVTVHARRGASIAGRVSYADGDPAVNVNVSLMRRSADGRVQKYLTGATIASLAGLRTDDRGMFRLTGLPPGEYIIGVNESVNHGGEGTDLGSAADDIPGTFRGMFTPQLLMTFYPSATSLKEAGVVKVAVGDERADVDITIPERDLRIVAGVVRTRRGGQPIARAQVSITRRDDSLTPSGPAPAYFGPSEYGPNGTITDEAGRWQLKEIPDGPYTIHVKPPEEYEGAMGPLSNSNISIPSASVSAGDGAGTTNSNGSYTPPRRRRVYPPARRELEVSGDVSEFVVEVAEGARVSGTVSVEGGTAPRYGHVSLMHVAEAGAAPDYSGAQSGGGLEGGRFIVEGLPAGRFSFHPSVQGVEGGTYLKSITWNGRDLMREPLELAEGALVEGVRIVYGRNPATLHVTVRAAAGRPTMDNLFVSLVPAITSDSAFSFCTPGATGMCVINAPPGDYRVLVMPRPTTPGAYEQEVKRRAANAPHVTLREGETSRVQVDAPDY